MRESCIEAQPNGLMPSSGAAIFFALSVLPAWAHWSHRMRPSPPRTNRRRLAKVCSHSETSG